jgi:hypothetical protein
VDFTGDCITDAATARHVSHLGISRPPHGQSFIPPVVEGRFPTPTCYFPWQTAKAVSKFHFHCLHGVTGVRSFMKPDRCYQPSARWYTDSDQQPCLKLNCALQGDCTVANTSNLSLDRDPTGRNTNSCEIRGGMPTSWPPFIPHSLPHQETDNSTTATSILKNLW